MVEREILLTTKESKMKSNLSLSTTLSYDVMDNLVESFLFNQGYMNAANVFRAQRREKDRLRTKLTVKSESKTTSKSETTAHISESNYDVRDKMYEKHSEECKLTARYKLRQLIISKDFDGIIKILETEFKGFLNSSIPLHVSAKFSIHCQHFCDLIGSNQQMDALEFAQNTFRDYIGKIPKSDQVLRALITFI